MKPFCCHTSGLDDKLHEECGIFGIAVDKEDPLRPADECYNALFALQHRGQQSCGIAVSDSKIIDTYKANGLVDDVFKEKTLAAMNGYLAIGHVRYSRKEDSSSVNAQPITITHGNGMLSLAVNGSLVNADSLRQDCEARGGIFQTSTHAEVISYIFVRERLRTNTSEDALKNAMRYLVGAYSLLLLNDRKLIAARDPNGFRPLCMGHIGKNIVFASESCAFDAVGAEFIRDVEPGEIIVVEKGRVRSIKSGIEARGALCIFEFVYFARPDSVMDGMSVELFRQRAGRALAKNDNVKGDVVIGVPDSGISAALGYAKESGLPYETGLVKNRYIGRTFIQTTQATREKHVNIKLNALAAVVRGKKVIMVDDSIVRGTTCARIINILREAGASEVHMRVSSMPFLYPCYFGTDIPAREALIANNRSIDEIQRIIGVDSLKYLTAEDVFEISSELGCGFCDACFTGDYAVPVPVD